VRIAICDDEQPYLDTLSSLIGAYAGGSGQAFHVCPFLSARDLLAAANREKFDLIFLDISMPEISGLALAEQIRRTDAEVQIVFVTNLAQEMPRGFDVMASGFAIKPILDQTLYDVLNRAVTLYRRRRIPPYEVTLKGGAKGTLVLQDVLYLESRLHTLRAVSQGTECEYWGRLSEELTRLSQYGFAQIHRSYLVNMAWVWIVSGKSVTFTNNTSLQMGPKFAPGFKETYRKYKKGGVG